MTCTSQVSCGADGPDVDDAGPDVPGRVVVVFRLATKRTTADTGADVDAAAGTTSQVPASPGPTNGAHTPPGDFARRLHLPLARISIPPGDADVAGAPNSEGPAHWLHVPTRSLFTADGVDGTGACAGSPQAAGVTAVPGGEVVGVTGRVVGGAVVGDVVTGAVVGVTAEVVDGVPVVGDEGDVVWPGLGPAVVVGPGPPGKVDWLADARWFPLSCESGESGVASATTRPTATAPAPAAASLRTRRMRAARA